MKDVLCKYNLTLHDATRKFLYQLWHHRSPDISRLFAFGQQKTISSYMKHEDKPDSQANPACYLQKISPIPIVAFNLRMNQYKQPRSMDFGPYYHHLGLRYPASNFISLCDSQAVIHLSHSPFSRTTPPPATLHQLQKYSDVEYWSTAHEGELETLDTNNTIVWISDRQIPPSAKLNSLKIKYRYKRSDEGTVNIRKARCTVRCDRMKPYIHFNPDDTTTYVSKRPPTRKIFCLTPTLNPSPEQLEISSAFLHEKCEHSNPAYVTRILPSNGSFKHSCRAGILRGSLYDNLPGFHIYFEALASFLKSKRYAQTDSDPCLFL